MKRKKLEAKLVLNKETIACVGKNEMPYVKGGVVTEGDLFTEYPDGGCPKTIADSRFYTCRCWV